MNKLCICLCAALVAASCARRGAGNADQAAAPAASGGETASREKLVCHREQVTGSMVRKRICRYESEQRQSRDAAEEAMRARSQNAKPGEGP